MRFRLPACIFLLFLLARVTAQEGDSTESSLCNGNGPGQCVNAPCKENKNGDLRCDSEKKLYCDPETEKCKKSKLCASTGGPFWDNLTLILAPLILFIMLGMGSTTSWSHLVGVIKTSPKPFFIGMGSQFGWMPLIAFLSCWLMQFSDYISIGVIMLGATPGGTTSQLFSYFAKGDVTLSIAMTTASCAAALLLYPLLIFLYTGPFRPSEVEISFTDIVVSLMVVLVPCALGVLLRTKKPRIADWTEKLGSIVGVLLIIGVIITGIITNPVLVDWRNPDVFKAWILGLVFPLLGFWLAYGTAAFADLGRVWNRTIAIEAMLQNTTLTIALIAFAFPEPARCEVLLFPLVYSLTMFIDAGILMAIYQFLRRRRAWTDTGLETEMKEQEASRREVFSSLTSSSVSYETSSSSPDDMTTLTTRGTEVRYQSSSYSYSHAARFTDDDSSTTHSSADSRSFDHSSE